MRRCWRPGWRPGWRFGLLLVVALGAAGCASQDFDEPTAFEPPETTVIYTPAVEGAPSEAIQALMEESLAIFRRAEDGAQSLAFLRRRAEGDIPTAQRILRSFGYFRPAIDVRVQDAAPPPDDDAAQAPPTPGADDEDEAAVTQATATLLIDPGPVFALAAHRFVLDGFAPGPQPSLGPAEAYGSPVGSDAQAAPILAAEGQALADIRRQGFFYAANVGRDAVADLQASSLEVETAFDTGRRYRFGPVSIAGAPNVETAYLLTYLPWQEGDIVDPAKLGAYQRALLGTGLFRSGFVTLPETPPDSEIAPVEVELQEAPFRTVQFGLRFSTDEGPGARAEYEHRNLFGANEQLTLTLDVALEEQVAAAEYRKPQYLRPGQELVAGLELRRVDDDAFEELGTTATVGLRRRLGPRWTVGAGLLAEASVIDDEGDEATAILAGVPVFAAYDSTASLLNPTDGERLLVELAPFAGSFDSEPTVFGVIDTRASAYRPLDENARWVIAVRGRIGVIASGDFDDIPATRRLYSGGSGSVRGFAEDFIGELDDQNDPVGGRSALEAGVELRYPIVGDLGGVVFVEAGSVSEAIFPDFDQGVQVGAGAGIRYYSPVGPIRLDVAVPVNGRDADDDFQLFISIGQAF
ncbi:MAG: autotransporter assembly complex family protein [Pseudomonadota bacterium]